MTEGNTMYQEAQADRLKQVLARSAGDGHFRQKLLDDPAAILGAAGIDTPQGVKLVVVQDSDTVLHIVIPGAPVDAELSDAQLGNLAGAGVPNRFNS